MASRNDITGDVIATKGTSNAYRDNYDAIFRKKAPQKTREELILERALENWNSGKTGVLGMTWDETFPSIQEALLIHAESELFDEGLLT